MAAIILPDSDSGEHAIEGLQQSEEEIQEVIMAPLNLPEDAHMDYLSVTTADTVEVPMQEKSLEEPT